METKVAGRKIWRRNNYGVWLKANQARRIVVTLNKRSGREEGRRGNGKYEAD